MKTSNRLDGLPAAKPSVLVRSASLGCIALKGVGARQAKMSQRVQHRSQIDPSREAPDADVIVCDAAHLPLTTLNIRDVAPVWAESFREFHLGPAVLVAKLLSNGDYHLVAVTSVV